MTKQKYQKVGSQDDKFGSEWYLSKTISSWMKFIAWIKRKKCYIDLSISKTVPTQPF